MKKKKFFLSVEWQTKQHPFELFTADKKQNERPTEHNESLYHILMDFSDGGNVGFQNSEIE